MKNKFKLLPLIFPTYEWFPERHTDNDTKAFGKSKKCKQLRAKNRKKNR